MQIQYGVDKIRHLGSMPEDSGSKYKSTAFSEVDALVGKASKSQLPRSNTF